MYLNYDKVNEFTGKILFIRSRKMKVPYPNTSRRHERASICRKSGTVEGSVNTIQTIVIHRISISSTRNTPDAPPNPSTPSGVRALHVVHNHCNYPLHPCFLLFLLPSSFPVVVKVSKYLTILLL